MFNLKSYRQLGKNKISLTVLFIGLVSISVLLTFTILLFASYQSNKQALLTTTLSLNYSTAAKMSQTMDSLFKTMHISLVTTARYLSNNKQLSGEDMQKQLELLRQTGNYFNSLALIDENGILRGVSYTAESISNVGKNISAPAALQALSSRKSYISNPFYSPTGHLIILMSEPLFDTDGTYRGFLAGTLYLQEPNVLNTIFGDNHYDESGTYLYVVDTNGHLLFHPETSRLGENVSANQVVKRVLEGESGQEVVVNTQGVTLLAGYSPVNDNGWGIIVNSPIDGMYKNLNRMICSNIFYTSIPFCLLLIIAIWIARRLAGPFVSLADLVIRLGQGERVTPPDVTNLWNREADLLTRTITDAFQGMHQRTDQLVHAAMTDPLTGLTNRRFLEVLLHQWTLEQSPFSMIVLDIDHFKSINDTYGHQMGDEVLKHLANIITQSIRSADIGCRFGGEEFIILLPKSSSTEAFQVAERIRGSMERSINPCGQTVTVSLGLAHYPTQGVTAESLFHLADQSLYKAKENGRNQTVSAD